MSNRVIFMAAVGRDQIALCDRNCHKSIEHSLVMTGGIPNYLVPLRNRYGIIGPIPPARLSKEAHQGRDQGQSAGHQGRREARRSTRSSRTPLTTGFATTRSACRSCSIRASIAFISTKPGTRTRASTRCIAIGTRCMAIRRITRARRSSRRTPRTSCWPRCRRRRSCTSATAAAPFRIRASTSRS